MSPRGDGGVAAACTIFSSWPMVPAPLDDRRMVARDLAGLLQARGKIDTIGTRVPPRPYRMNVFPRGTAALLVAPLPLPALAADAPAAAASAASAASGASMATATRCTAPTADK